MKKVLVRIVIYGIAVLILLSSIVTCSSNTLYSYQKSLQEITSTPPVGETELVDFYFGRCRERNSAILAEDSWFVAKLANADMQRWAEASGHLLLLDADGDELGRVSFEDWVIPVSSTQWLVDELLLNEARPRTISSCDDMELMLTSVDWTEINDEYSQHSLDSEIQGYSASSGDFPRHSIEVEIRNTGSHAVYRATVFAVVLNDEGELVDILYSTLPGEWAIGERVRPGKELTVRAESLSVSGRCLGRSDPDHFRIEYWVNAMTAIGEPVTDHEVVDIP